MALPQPGEIFDNFKVTKILGEGGMGQVFLAEDIKLSRKVALKFLGHNGGQKIDPKVLIRFENEAKILASLNHSNIVNIYTFGTYAGIHYLAMEYVEGVTLSQVIESKRFGVVDALKAIKEVITGLQQAHEKGILHRDIKPANLLVGPKNNIKIVDFGISKSLMEDDHKLTKENHFIGTLNYMAPEILKGLPPTPASDLYAVGVVFYELITGSNPYSLRDKIATIDKIRHEQLTLPQEVRNLIPPELESIIHKLIANKKEERYQSCQEALDDLEKISDNYLPDFHGVSLRPEVEVVNRKENQKILTKMGYSEQESEIIIKLAVKLVELQNYEENTNDETVDMSKSPSLDSISIDRHSLNMAIENYETSKSQTRSIESAKGSKSTDKKASIPFPLFKPLSLLKWSLIFAFFTINYLIFSKAAFNVGVDFSGFEIVTSLFKSEKSQNDSESLSKLDEVKNNIKKVALRNLSSIPAGEKKPLPEGTRIKFKATKFNTVTGDYLFNQNNHLVIKQVKDNTMFAFYQDGRTAQWSTQHISSHAFLPPLRWFDKKGLNIQVTPHGNFESFYPIHIGKAAQFTYKTIASGGSFKESERSCEVLSSEKQTIANQSLSVFVISCSTQTDKVSEVGKYYYSPDWNLIVKKEVLETSPAGKFEETFVLEKIDFPQATQ